MKTISEKELEDVNEALRSAYAIATRKGANTNWDAWRQRLVDILIDQSELMHGTRHTEAAICTARTFYLSPDE